MTAGDAQGASEGVDGSRRPDPGEHEAGVPATTSQEQPTAEAAASPVPEEGDRSPESAPRTARPQETAAPSGAKWLKAATVASAAGTVMAAFAAIGALYFSNSTLSASNDQLGLARQTAQSELLKSAAEQLDSDKESVRLSGVYLLERLAQDSKADQPTVRRLLEAFIRTETLDRPCETSRREAPVDTQAALDVIAKYVAQPAPTPRVNLQRACLAQAALYNTDLTGVDFAGVNLTGAVLNVSRFHGANLEGALLQFSHSVATIFSDANLSSANMASANLCTANLTGADLDDANLVDARLSEANLTDATLSNANLEGATLWNANLTGAYLRSANLIGAELFSANLTRVDLIGAQLHSANLNNAQLDNAILAGADLTGADLTGADLTGANLDGTNLNDVVYDSQTRWPDGFTPPR
ncbi:pentapeptide repeat-containing protein [Nocardia abscessus]|uniref:pentapeptide repeat-containing protein n=1 Tax=Nocardia abscessus TaxID=120957 RepID=UPI002454B2D9|nr:pentapeptide repeat-containing protein [Nocardia abscessus]